MSRSIRLSEKHGVNPSLINCFFCGESKGIALMGKLKGDAEAPRSCVMDYEPCDKCKAMFDQGVLLIGVTTTQPSDGRPPLTAQGGESVYPTGVHAVITTDAASRLFNIQREWKCGDKLFIDHEMLVQMTTPPEDSEN